MIVEGLAPQSIALAVRLLRAGELVGLPTETVYGLAANADDAAAVAKVFQAKGRPADHPLIVHVLGHAQVAHFARDVPAVADALMQAFWPGPLTVILPRRAGVAVAAAGGQDSIGLRCPAHPVVRAVLKACQEAGATDDGEPLWGLAAPSANQFGRVSPTTAAHVQSEFGEPLLILDGGACSVGIESTIVDCTRGAPVVLRPGAISRAQVEEVARAASQPSPRLQETPAAPRASGTLESHYAPRAKVRLMNAPSLQSALDLLGADLDAGNTVIATYSRAILRSRSSKVIRRRMPDDAVATAQQLFAVLREFDAQGAQLIWVETPPEGPEWEGVRDRLQRAAAA
ncbi:L-threonylcarbamoyladenylate synthase [Rhodoferax sp.]|uniref:L-threonylcarbamoyladenylate synthase n=1 Tax=Rhodoferax sp. TaxID=50421 RepID=UPI0027560D83|nr:L-threonylcarbamoyladenylate synthase [Rhodoferax sp.]